MEGAAETGRQFGTLTWGSVKALGSFFTPGSLRSYTSQLTGDTSSSSSGEKATGSSGKTDQNRFLSPVGAVRVAGQAARSGFSDVLILLVLINVFVGLFNLVPLLPLDGGHVAIATYARIRSRK